MARCPTCSHENDDFATICGNCKGFLQNRVANLNFFETSWGILESPRPTFRIITLAEHKNYSLLLFSFLGIAASFSIFFFQKLGLFFESLVDLIPWAVSGGVAFGFVMAFPLSLTLHGAARMMGSRMKLRHSYALIAYSCVPVLLSLVLVLPIELMTFGMYLFTSNPHPAVIKPVSYYVLIGFDTLLALWAVVLATIGTSVVHRFSLVKSVVPIACLLAVLSGAIFTGGPLLARILQAE